MKSIGGGIITARQAKKGIFQYADLGIDNVYPVDLGLQDIYPNNDFDDESIEEEE